MISNSQSFSLSFEMLSLFTLTLVNDRNLLHSFLKLFALVLLLFDTSNIIPIVVPFRLYGEVCIVYLMFGSKYVGTSLFTFSFLITSNCCHSSPILIAG